MSRYIKNIIRQGEHQRLDFKYEINDSRKIAKTLVAFANTDGGKLLIGVKDNGNIAGIHTDEEYYMIEAAAQLYCKPEIHFEFDRWVVEGKTVLEITVPVSEKKPCYAKTEDGKWLAYVRVGDQNLLANRVLTGVWKKQQGKKGTIIRYREAEEILMRYLNENEFITQSKFARIAKIPRRMTETVLINLVYTHVLGVEITDKGVYYRLMPSDL